MADATLRSAARVATLVALPLAVVAGVAVYTMLNGPGSAPAPAPTRQQATTAVEMPAPPLGEAPAALCRALLNRLPPRLGDLDRRPVTAGPDQNAAYGEPPATLACGVAPPSVPADAQLWEINGVCWWATQGSAGSTWYLLHRDVTILMTVPVAHAGPSRFAVDVAPAIDAVLARRATPCG